MKMTRPVLNSVRLLDTLALILSEIEADELVAKPSPAIFCAALLIATVSSAESQAYIAYAWCTSGHGWAGGLSCGFDTYAHCLENARLINANCVPNPFIEPYPQQVSSPRTTKGR
jgi:Protein of unknown function (DUF3551)